MSEETFEAKDIERKVHNLAEAMNGIKSAQADRDDVVVDMKHARQSRLELLADDLRSVFEELPDDNDQFEFSLTNGEVPRLWIDMTSFIRLGADGREYEFVKDTRLGRTILGKTHKRARMGRLVTKYVAERVLERERMIEGDWISMKGGAVQLDNEDTLEEIAKTVEVEPAKAAKTDITYYVLWFLIGVFLVIGLLAAAIGMGEADRILGWIETTQNFFHSNSSSVTN